MKKSFRRNALLTVNWLASLAVIVAAIALTAHAAPREPAKPAAKAGPRFVDRGAYVEDTTTNLLWMKDGKAAGKMNWQQATKWAKTAKVGKFNGGWRLPTIEECAGIFPATEKPWTNTVYSPKQCCDGPGPFDAYWTSELDRSMDDYAFCYQWYADGGPNNCIASENQCYVRLVHDPVDGKKKRPATQPATKPAMQGEPESDEEPEPKR